MAPAWANASSWITPGSTGFPGKCPARNASSPVTLKCCDNTAPDVEFVDRVDEQEGRAVRQ